jgi:hypothetical protein
MAKTINLPKHVNVKKPSPTKTGKGHFAAAAQRIAKLRSGHLQHGVPKHAPVGAKPIGGSGFTKKPKFGTVQTSEAQTGLNPKQQGATNKKSQKNSKAHNADMDIERDD